jgi:hypothetical protein
MYELFLLILIFIIISRYELKYIILLSIIIFIFLSYFKYNSSKYSNDVSDTLNSLSKYKKSNEIEYKYGMKYWSKFTNIINNFDKYEDPYDKYDKAEQLLTTSMKHFKSLIISTGDRKLKKIIDTLYEEGLQSLRSISIKLNKEWYENPNTTKKQIIFDLPKPHNTSSI